VRIQILSDLHIDVNYRYVKESNKYNIYKLFENKADADVLILAGDTCQLTFNKKNNFLLNYVLPNYDCVIEIPGNHDYYGLDWNFENDLNYDFENYHYLDNRVFIYNGVKFIGTTLWSDIPINKSALITNSINDYNYIKGFTTDISTKEFKKNKKFIFDNLTDEYTNIVISHHLPFTNLIGNEYVNNRVNSAYASNVIPPMCKDKINVKYWIHGHSHNIMQKEINECIFIRNPFGYITHTENKNVDIKIIKV